MTSTTPQIDLSPEAITRRRKLWVEKLRSGEYEQGKNYLNYDGKMCCLGVACEVLVEEGILSKNERGTCAHLFEYRSLKDENDFMVQRLPLAAREAFGFRGPLGEIEGQEYSSLAGANDDRVPFPQIADIIESNPPGLWVEEQQ